MKTDNSKKPIKPKKNLASKAARPGLSRLLKVEMQRKGLRKDIRSEACA
jgi:hypothetical protein